MQLDAEVHFLTKPAFAAIATANPHIQKVYTLTAAMRELIDQLKSEQYDAIIDLHHNLRSARIKFALGVPATSFRKLNFKKWLLVRFKINRLPAVHIVDRYLDAVAHLGVKNDGAGLDFFIPPEKKVNTQNQFALAPYHYVAIVIGAAHPTKCMTVEQLQAICNELDLPVILLGGKEEIAKSKAILKGIRNDRVRNAVGELDIIQSASVIDQAGGIITHDTGMMHIAAALKKEQRVVWGNTIPGFGMYPYYGHHPVSWQSFEVLGLSCRPCSKLGYEKCPKGHFKCMLDQDLSAIVKSVS